MAYPSDPVDVKIPGPKPLNLKDEKGGEIKLQLISGLVSLALIAWFIYFIITIAQHVNAWPF